MTIHTHLMALLILTLSFGCASVRRNTPPSYITKIEEGHILSCEPQSYIAIIPGTCVGSVEAKPRLIHGRCTCLQPSYVPIRNPAGFTCINRHAILAETIRLKETIDTAATSHGRLTSTSDFFTNPNVARMIRYVAELQAFEYALRNGLTNAEIQTYVSILQNLHPPNLTVTDHACTRSTRTVDLTLDHIPASD